MRILALAIAVALWFFLSWEKRENQSERVIQASVTYSNAEEMIVLDPIQQVDVRVRGDARRVRTLNPLLVNVLVELQSQEPGLAEATLSPEQVFVPEGIRVVSVNPNTLQVTLDRVRTLQLPVKVELVGEPAAGASVDEPVATPPAVEVRGPESRIGEASSVITRPVSLNGHATTFEESVSLIPPDPLANVDPPVVRVRVPMEPPQLSDEALQREPGRPATRDRDGDRSPNENGPPRDAGNGG
jgi:YbbR domain-containing protein